jgi:hypothetical protein
MTLTIELTGEIEQRLCEAAAAGGQDLSTCVQQILAEHFVIPEAANAPRLAAEEWPTPPRGETPDAFMGRLREMVRRHAVRCGHVDDSRESIYAGCGE